VHNCDLEAMSKRSNDDRTIAEVYDDIADRYFRMMLILRLVARNYRANNNNQRNNPRAAQPPAAVTEIIVIPSDSDED